MSVDETAKRIVHAAEQGWGADCSLPPDYSYEDVQAMAKLWQVRSRITDELKVALATYKANRLLESTRAANALLAEIEALEDKNER